MIINLPGAPYTLRSSDGFVFLTPNGGEQINLTSPKREDFAFLGVFFNSLAPSNVRTHFREVHPTWSTPRITGTEPIVEENHSLPSDEGDSGDESSL